VLVLKKQKPVITSDGRFCVGSGQSKVKRGGPANRRENAGYQKEKKKETGRPVLGGDSEVQINGHTNLECQRNREEKSGDMQNAQERATKTARQRGERGLQSGLIKTDGGQKSRVFGEEKPKRGVNSDKVGGGKLRA